MAGAGARHWQPGPIYAARQGRGHAVLPSGARQRAVAGAAARQVANCDEDAAAHCRPAPAARPGSCVRRLGCVLRPAEWQSAFDKRALAVNWRGPDRTAPSAQLCRRHALLEQLNVPQLADAAWRARRRSWQARHRRAGIASLAPVSSSTLTCTCQACADAHVDTNHDDTETTAHCRVRVCDTRTVAVV